MVNLKEFCEFLAIPSISSEPAYKEDMRRCASWLKEKLDLLGFSTQIWETTGHPILFASSTNDPTKPTLLIYNHYDVQPVDPLELWHTPPFEPTVRDGQIFARGAQDNKGQCFYVLEALRMLKEKHGQFPLNIKLIIEGEEECGSHSLHEILPLKEKELSSECVAIVDLGIPSQDSPAITLGTRGLVTFELEVQGSTTDLHSGSHGGLAYNPIQALVKILSEAKDSKGKIAIKGFYDEVKEAPNEELKHVNFIFDEKVYENNFGIKATGGESTFSPLERNWLRPTLEINGIWGGYTGQGFKTVIPSKAFAKLSCRLVPNQNPKKILACLKDHFEKSAPPGTKVIFKSHGDGGEATRTSATSPAAKSFQKAFADVFKKPCQCILEGASIPIIPELAKASGAEPILVGLGLPTDNIHAPNEHFSIDRLEKGAHVMVKAIEYLAENMSV